MKDDPLAPALTPNQIVAYNLKRAREHHGWTQTEAAKRLAPHLGQEWSKVSWSAAERSVAGDRIRQFSADDIAAFCMAFQLPASWFFTPPFEDEDAPCGWIGAGDDGGAGWAVNEFTTTVVPATDESDRQAKMARALAKYTVRHLDDIQEGQSKAEELASLLGTLGNVIRGLGERAIKED